MHPYPSEFLYLKSGFSFENKHRWFISQSSDDLSARVLFITVLKEPHAIFCHPQNVWIWKPMGAVRTASAKLQHKRQHTQTGHTRVLKSLCPTRKETSFSDHTLTFASHSKTIQKVVHPTRSPRQQWPLSWTKNGDLSIVLQLGWAKDLSAPL